VRPVALIILACAVGGCQITQATFGAVKKLKPDYAQVPVEPLREVAREIERAVSEANRNPEIPDRGGIAVNTDAIRQAIRSRAARSELLHAFLDTGHAWERRDGHVWIRRTGEWKRFGTRRDRDRYALLVDSETNDRWTLYEGIVRSSNLSPRALPAVQEIFFNARLKFMRKGQLFETESGSAGRIGGEP